MKLFPRFLVFYSKPSLFFSQPLILVTLLWGSNSHITAPSTVSSSDFLDLAPFWLFMGLFLVPRSLSYGVFSHLIRFARVCSNVDDFNNRNLFLTAKLLKQGYRYHKIQKAFSKFYHRHSE